MMLRPWQPFVVACKPSQKAKQPRRCKRPCTHGQARCGQKEAQAAEAIFKSVRRKGVLPCRVSVRVVLVMEPVVGQMSYKQMDFLDQHRVLPQFLQIPTPLQTNPPEVGQ